MIVHSVKVDNAVQELGAGQMKAGDGQFDITVRQMGMLSADEYVCIDIRGTAAYRHGHIPGAVCWDGDEESFQKFPEDKKLVVYCTYGEKSVAIAEKLVRRGYEAYSLSGGYREWLLQYSDELSADELKRYDRQIILPQVGSEGQKRLKNSRVLIVGAGGLGSPAALYLAGAGVGTIGIVDADTVSISNLQRQIVHSMETQSMNKAESAKLSLQKLNDRIDVAAYPCALTADNAKEIIGTYDFVIDAVDNFETKFLINDVCVLMGKPFCHAGILQFTGQVMTYVPGDYPCYRCVFEEVPESDSVPSCSEAGIIGAVAGIIGSIQALEAVKYLLGAGELLTGKIFVLDGLSMRTRIVPVDKKNEKCKVCGNLRSP